MPHKQNYRLLLAIGNDEIEEGIRALPGVTVIDSDPDIEIITDILNYETVDFVIVNTVLSEEKSVMLAKKAKEKLVKVIALLKDYKDKDLITMLVGLGAKAFVSFDELQRIKGYIKEYPEEFDFMRLQKIGPSGPRLSEPHHLSNDLKGKIFIGVFNICSGAGATTTLVELAENIANSGYLPICISVDGSADFEFINRKKCKADYVMLNEENLLKDLNKIYSEMDHNVILFDFGRIFDLDLAGNLKEILLGKEAYREFLRCGFKVGLAFSDPWHEGKLKFFQKQQIGGDLSILLSGFGTQDAMKSYPDLNFHDRDKLAEFIDEMKVRVGISRADSGKCWLIRFGIRRKADQ